MLDQHSVNKAAPDNTKGRVSNKHVEPVGLGGAASENVVVLQLLRKMWAGDRGAAAVFVTRYGSQIRRRIRGKLSPAMRRIYDSQEILSTLGRRLDQFVRSGKLEAANEQQLWALVFRMANNAVIDKARVFRRLQQVEDEDGVFAQELSRHLRQALHTRTEGVDIEVDRALNVLPDRTDREILSLWLVGTHHTAIAEHLDLSATAVRKRWQKIKWKLRRRFAAESHR